MAIFNRNLYAAIALLALLSLALVGLRAEALEVIAEAEPNNTCPTAQHVGLVTLPVRVDGYLDSARHNRQDIDFFAFEAEPGLLLAATLASQIYPEGTDGQLLVGLFDSSCQPLAWNDKWHHVEGDADDGAHLRFKVPADGQFVLAATGATDRGFAGEAPAGGFVSGPYFLRISDPFPFPIESTSYLLSGRVIDRETGAGLSGRHPPFARVSLQSCAWISWGCHPNVATVVPDGEGWFEIVGWEYPSHPGGGTNHEGQFLINAWTNDHDPTTWVFFADPTREVSMEFSLERPPANIGQLGVYSSPVEFGTVSPCDDVPASGGTCRYSVEVFNRSAERIQGVAWSNVEAQGTGAGLGYTQFTASRQQNANLRAQSSTVLRFSFDVPAGIAEGATMCADAWISSREDAFLGSLWTESLFCIQKQGTTFIAMEP